MRESILVVLILISAFSCAFVAYMLNTDFGRVEVRSLTYPEPDGISSLLYKPKSVEGKTPVAILVHGVSSSKESMSAIALELAKRGISSLCIDAKGHGDSGGYLNVSSDPTIGLKEALDFLRSQEFIENVSIALIGHSLGASAVRASSTESVAQVLIGGGFSVVKQNAYTELNSTKPKNVLFIVGRGDVLFDSNDLRKELAPVFGVSGEIEVGRVYGDFSIGTARKLVVPQTTHLLEPVDPVAVQETVNWICLSLAEKCDHFDITYHYRDSLMITSILLILSLTFPLSRFLMKPESHHTIERRLKESTALILWVLPSFLIFVPSFLIGMNVRFPPVLFGNSVTIWFSLSSIYGFLLIKFASGKFDFKLEMSNPARQLLAASITFLVIYSFFLIIKSLSGMNLWIYVPIFRVLGFRRALLMTYFLPFFFSYFLIENAISHAEGEKSLLGLVKFTGVRVAPIILILLIHYSSIFLFNFKIFGSLAGFSLEFLPLICFLMSLAGVYTFWFNKLMGSLLTGAFLNSLIFSWASASVFPFGGFS